MGAEGGYCYFETENPQKMLALLEPFQFLNWDDRVPFPTNLEINSYVLGTYGSFQSLSLLDFEQVMEELDHSVGSEYDLTWEELFEEYHTRPWPTYSNSVLDKIVENLLTPPKDFAKVPLKVWHQEVKDLAPNLQVQSRETWT